MERLYAQIVGWGKYLPERVLTNFDLEKMVDTSDEWIVSHTGIRERRIAGEGETMATMGAAAARDALAVAEVQPEDVDLVIVATSTPDYQFPWGAGLIQAELRLKNAATFEIRAGCSGFLYALAIASQFISTGTYKTILVIGSEVISRFINWKDRRTCVLFGDGAGAIVLQPSPQPTGLLSFSMGSDGAGTEAFYVPIAGSKHYIDEESLARGDQYMRMDGQTLARYSLKTMRQAAQEALRASGLSAEEIDLFIPHQANAKLIEIVARGLGIPMEKVWINIDRYANTSAASIPISLCEALDSGRIKKGDTILMVAFGAGVTWAGAVVHFGELVDLPDVVEWQASISEAFSLSQIRESLRTLPQRVADRASMLLLPLYTTTRRFTGRFGNWRSLLRRENGEAKESNV